MEFAFFPFLFLSRSLSICASFIKLIHLHFTPIYSRHSKLWDAISGAELRTFSHKRIVKAVDISKSSRQILTGGQDKLLRIWDIERGVCTTTLEGHQDTVRQVLWMRNNEHLVLSGEFIIPSLFRETKLTKR